MNFEFKHLIKFLLLTLIVITISLILVVFVFRIYRINNNFMKPTFEANNKVLVSKIANITGYKRNNIVIYRPDVFQEDFLLSGRIIGRPNEKVYMKNGEIYIDDKKFNDDKGDEIINAGILEQPITLKNEEYIIISDSRKNSSDSRLESIGVVRENQIVGKVWFKISQGIGFVR